LEDRRAKKKLTQREDLRAHCYGGVWATGKGKAKRARARAESWRNRSWACRAYGARSQRVGFPALAGWANICRAAGAGARGTGLKTRHYTSETQERGPKGPAQRELGGGALQRGGMNEGVDFVEELVDF